MRKKVILLLSFTISLRVFATEQVPDILLFKDLTLNLSTGWGHPSPLQTYFYQNNLKYPFIGISTNNYRGHIATWSIKEDKFYLKAIDVELKIHSPSHYNIRSKDGSHSNRDLIFADWFSGVIICDKPVRKGSWESVSTFYFQIRHGKVILMAEMTPEELKKLYNTSDEKTGKGLFDKYKLILLAENYVSYYYRLNEKDEIEYKNQKCQLNTGVSKLSPVYERYSNEHLNWPFNWENLEKSGAPHCKWKITNDSLKLTGLELYSGLRFDSINKENIDLNILLPGEVKNKEVFADWLTGVHLIINGIDTVYQFGFKDFKPTEYTYCRFEKGILKETYSFPANFDGKDGDPLDPKLKKLRDEYLKPSTLSTGL